MSEQRVGKERRRTKRRPVLNSFSLFVVIPKKGVHRLQLHDVSDLGVGFDIDLEGEGPDTFSITEGETVDIRFYLNQTLYIPLVVEVRRVERHGSVRRVGAEFVEKDSRAYQAFQSFVQTIDGIVDAIHLDGQPEAESEA